MIYNWITTRHQSIKDEWASFNIPDTSKMTLEEKKELLKTISKEEHSRRMKLRSQAYACAQLLEQINQDMTDAEIIEFMQSEVLKTREAMLDIKGDDVCQKFGDMCNLSAIWADYQNMMNDMKEEGII